MNDITTLQRLGPCLLENMYVKKTKHRFLLFVYFGSFCMYILKVVPDLLEKKKIGTVLIIFYIMRPCFPQVGLGILRPVLYMILCGHT